MIPSEWTKRTWEKLQNMPDNETAWEILEAAGAELVNSVIEPIVDRHFEGGPVYKAPEEDRTVTEPDAEEDRS